MATKVVPRRLVIDASVARLAGGNEAMYPTSVHCRDFLQAVLDICHQIVMTPDIKQEWVKHKSRFVTIWLHQMVVKKKFTFLDVPVNNNLWKKVKNFANSDKERGEMIKDLRLLEAAIATDKTVISLDDNTARKFFSKATVQIHELNNIVWVNPDKIEEEKPIEWLRNGAEPDSKRLLGTCNKFEF